MKKLAVLLAAYNGERYIAQQLDSLLNQTFQDFSLYIHDDGSEDGTLLILQDYARRYPGQIHLLDYAPVHGAKDNFLSLLRQVEAEYYMFCDEDDYWLPEKIQLSMERMKETERQEKDVPCVVFSDMSVADASLQVIHPSYLQYRKKDPKNLTLKALLVENTAAGCTMLYNRALAELAVLYTEGDHIFMHDWWLMLIAAAVGRIGWIDKPLLLYRQHGDNIVGARTGKVSWLNRIIKNVLRGRQLEASREGIFYQRSMAAELEGILNQLEASSEKDRFEKVLTACSSAERKLLQELAHIESRPRRRRIYFYWKNRLLKRDGKNIWKLLLV